MYMYLDRCVLKLILSPLRSIQTSLFFYSFVGIILVLIVRGNQPSQLLCSALSKLKGVASSSMELIWQECPLQTFEAEGME